MRKPVLFATLMSVLLAAGHLLAAAPAQDPQSPSAHSSPYANRLAGTVRVRLLKNLRSGKMKVGDPVEARLLADIKVGGEMVVPKNATFKGRVLELASYKEDGEISRLGFVFDRAVVKGAPDLPLHGVFIGMVMRDSAEGEGVSRLQETKLANLSRDAMAGTMSAQQSETISALYHSAVVGQPTTASSQYNCREEQGTLWCGPATNSLAGPIAPVRGMPGIFLQPENTPNGPVGVLVSGKRSIDINGGTELVLRLVPRP